MNNRIREIYKQSVDRSVELHGDTDGPVAWAWEEEFAKLIIQECIDAIKNYQPTSWDTPAVGATVIKDHFGFNHG